MRRCTVEREVRRGALAMFLLVIVTSALVHVKTVSVEAQSGRVIDLFTQRGGIGVNQSSDMFQPQELVVLYALVTYNDNPIANKLVAFHADGPSNPFENETAGGSSSTNERGIAEFSFRIPWPVEMPEAKVFGEWTVIATVDVADQRLVDTLTFKAGWLIEITNIATLNAQGNHEERYLRQSVIVFDLTVENNAKTPKPATITIDVQDSAGHPIIHIQLDNLVVPPGSSHYNASARIPVEASLGQATVLAAAYTAPVEQGGVLYSPAVSTTVEIIAHALVENDIAIIGVTPSETVVQKGEIVEIEVQVKNKGNETVSFGVAVYYDQALIGEERVEDLTPSVETQLVFIWNTTNVSQGTYTISAIAETVEGEVETADNTFVDGTVTVMLNAQWLPCIIYAFLVGLVIIGALALFWFISIARRRRRKKKKPRSFYAIISRPHI
jgi:hypothetical protein